ncbi:FHA domain-containing protein [Sinosporangium album]
MLTTLSVRAAGRVIPLPPDRTLSFGRDRSCDICLDPADPGISRVAGSVECDAGTWWIVNRSTRRTLHIVDDARRAVPLPVNAEGWPQGRYAVGLRVVTVLVAGELWTHELVLEPERAETASETEQPTPPPTSPPTPPPVPAVPAVARVPVLTEAHRAALAALASGYLRPHPHYDPRPLRYEHAAALLGVRAGRVRQRVERVRVRLVAAGVSGLDAVDARRSLCEWCLAMGLIGPHDLKLLPNLRRVPRRRGEA